MKQVVILVAAMASLAQANVNIEFRPESSSVVIGEAARVGLYLTWDGTGQGQSVSAVEVVFGWDTAFLSFAGLNSTGGAPLLTSDFPIAGSGGLNESSPPSDGDGFYRAYASLGSPLDTTGGILVTTFVFNTNALTSGTVVSMMPAAGSPSVQTRVYDGSTPNTIVTGALSGGAITIVPGPATLAALPITIAAIRRRRQMNR